MVNCKLDCFSCSHNYVSYYKGYRDSIARLTKDTGFPRQSSVHFRPSVNVVVPLFPFQSILGTSLVVQWLRIRLPTQGTRVRALVREDPTCRGAAKPVRHNY